MAFSIPPGFFPPAVARNGWPPPPPSISGAISLIIPAAFIFFPFARLSLTITTMFAFPAIEAPITATVSPWSFLSSDAIALRVSAESDSTSPETNLIPFILTAFPVSCCRDDLAAWILNLSIVLRRPEFSAMSFSTPSFIFPGLLSIAAISSRTASFSLIYSSARGPVTASILLTPAAIAPSDTILISPIAAVDSTCVPPQSSTESPNCTTLTVSPYFSPNSAMAPIERAFFRGIFSVTCFVWLFLTSWLAISSTFSISSLVILPKWLKSNLSL